MQMPDRSASVRAYYDQHREWFKTDRHDETRRQSLPHLIAHLETVHPEDRGQWGVLVKTDRNNRIPPDVLVWRPTLDHVDVVSGTGGMWDVHGVIDINAGGPNIWFWAPASVVDPNGEERALQGPPYAPGPTPGPIPNPTPDPTPEPTPEPTPVDLEPLLAAVAALDAKVQALLDRPPAPVALPKYVGKGSARIPYFGTAPIDLTLEPKP